MSLLGRLFDLRKSSRYPCRTAVTVDAEGQSVTGEMVDVGTGGCRIAVAGWPFPPTVQAGLRFTITAGEQRLAARLVWVAGDRSAVGCQFDAPLSQPVLRSLRGA